MAETEIVNSLIHDEALRALLDRLYVANDGQSQVINEYFAAGSERPTGYETDGSDSREFWKDKYVALDRDKAELVYALCRVGGAHAVVEAGTSFGVSTLYLAAGVRDNGGGLVVTCEIEEGKAAVARRNFREAGISDLIEVRVGDIRETLRGFDTPIDLLLLDIWAPIAGEVLKLTGPHIREGGLVVVDNIVARRDLYSEVIAYLADPANGFTAQTLPMEGGLELAVKTGV